MIMFDQEAPCADCQTKWTSDDECVMAVFACSDQPEYCLNCCGCEDHEGEPWYEAKENN